MREYIQTSLKAENNLFLLLLSLLQNQLYVKAEKCVFHSPSVTFLGFIVSEGAISMDLERVQVVRDWPTPESMMQLQCFLGYANFYQRFNKDFSSISTPHSLFAWNVKAEEAF